MADERPVAVVTALDDITADMVIAELNQRGVPVIRFNPTDLGTGLSMSARFGTDALPLEGSLRTPSRRAELDAIRSVYWRRATWPDFADLDPGDARWVAAQVRHGLGGVLYALPGCLYANHPLANQRADVKPLQLAAAQRLGFLVPPTLVSNRLEDIKDFAGTHGDVVYKALRWTAHSRGGVGHTTWTEPVEAADFDASVEAAPVLVQARVDKVADLRVTVVGEQVFAVRIDSDLLDWRTDYDALSYTVVNIPEDLEHALVGFLAHFGLAFGCFDLCVRRTDESPVWLELNPNGQWGWLEDETGLPLTAAFADLLQEGTRHASE